MRKDQKINIMVAADHGGYEGHMAGVGRNLSYFLPHLDQKRFKAILVILRDDGSLKNMLKGTGTKIYHLKRKKFDPFTLYDFIKIIKKEDIHILHLYQYACSNFGRLAGKIMGMPVILNADDLNYNYPWYQWIADRILKHATGGVIAVSEAVKTSCVNIRGLDPGKIMVIPNAVPTDFLKPPDRGQCQKLKKQWGLKNDRGIVGTITRLHGIKGNDILLKAAKIVLETLPDTRFVLVGEGPLRPRLERLAQKLRIDKNIVFTGYQKNVAGFLSVFDIKVIASNSEGLSFALLEAMAMGKPVVATDVGGVNGIVRQGITGILVSPQDPEAMAEKIIYLLQNKHERKRLGANAYEESTKFTLRAHTKALEKVYEKMAASVKGEL